MARFGFLSSYPPTRCGLATFTASLASAMVRAHDDAFVVRVTDEPAQLGARRERGLPVSTLVNGNRQSAIAAVRMLNSADIAVIQHEYGIYGGQDGDEVVGILGGLRVPTVVVLHTVLADPSPHQRHVLEQVARYASAVVVMSEAALGNLRDNYAVDVSAVSVIPHGVHAVEPLGRVTASTRPVVLTWGLIGPGKGIEWGIGALADLRDLDPRPVYRVLGQTHPNVLRTDGDVYRNHLLALAGSLRVEESVELDGRYQSAVELADAVMSADVVLLPYDSQTQVTSGVLAEAVAAGKPVVATAFPHAVELLSGGAGIVVPHRSPTAIAHALRAVLTDSAVAASMASAARRATEQTSWPEVGAQYRALALRLRSAVAV